MKADGDTGFLYQHLFGYRVFLRRRQDFMSAAMCEWLCKEIYFKYYMPRNGDTVVDVGAGLGHEAFWLFDRSPHVRYIGVEVQPSIYEALANSFNESGRDCQAVGKAISTDDGLFIGSSSNYTEASTSGPGYMEVPTIAWFNFLSRYRVDTVDLLKINIEGGESALLEELRPLSNVRRVIVSAHDFRADRGDGEQYRTRQIVLDHLGKAGFSVKAIAEDNWLRNWLYAERCARS